jgi:ribosomal protein S18 acetylase RimI-like enzyme
MSNTWKIREVDISEYDAWTRLFRGYCDFYERPTSDEHQLQIWSWIHDEKIVEALVAVEIDDSGFEVGVPRALAHLREWIRPLRGVRSGYLDDLFVDPELRGSGAVDALFAKINMMALERRWDVIRWTTADNNYRARGTYDKVALRTSWITYDMTPKRLEFIDPK